MFPQREMMVQKMDWICHRPALVKIRRSMGAGAGGRKTEKNGEKKTQGCMSQTVVVSSQHKSVPAILVPALVVSVSPVFPSLCLSKWWEVGGGGGGGGL